MVVGKSVMTTDGKTKANVIDDGAQKSCDCIFLAESARCGCDNVCDSGRETADCILWALVDL